MSSSLEERVAKIEGILEQMDKRLNHIESEVRDLRTHFDGEIKGLRGLIEAWRADFDKKSGDMKAGLDKRIDDSKTELYGEIKGLRNLIESWRMEFDKKLGDLKTSFENKIESLRTELYGEIRDLRGRFYWIIGIQITMWVTIILTILFKHA
jgi:chromosome segregation ATPase